MDEMEQVYIVLPGISSTSVNDGNWHHIAGTVSNGTWRVYVDGILENSSLAGPAGSFANLNQPFLIGRVYGSHFKGDIKEVSYWSFSKTQTQLQIDAITTFTGNESGLVGYWPLNDNSSPANDLTALNNATLLNGASYSFENTLSYTADVVSFNDYYPYGMLLPYTCQEVPVSDPNGTQMLIEESVQYSALQGTQINA